ncbi:MAG: Rho GTPase activation protein [Benjaminiella poitrasii]|nr:MAG: Rho GTPase activation protein [Benjaminiella poitrasii]
MPLIKMIYDETASETKKQPNSLLTFLQNVTFILGTTTSAFITKGIFGAPLRSASLCGSISREGLTIPEPVYRCFEEIMKRGLLVEGIFRLSGSAPEIDRLLSDFDKPPTYGKYLDLKNSDIHAITGVVKRYLRQLPDPVIPLSYHERFIELYDESNMSDPLIIDAFANIIHQLPIEHFHLVHYIILLASRIQHYAQVNMMNPEALAIVLAPVCTGLLETTDTITHKKRLVFIETNTKWTRIWTLLIEHAETLLESWKPLLMWRRQVMVTGGHHTVPCHYNNNTNKIESNSAFDETTTDSSCDGEKGTESEILLDIAPPLFNSRRSMTTAANKYKVVVMRQKSRSYQSSSMVVQR